MAAPVIDSRIGELYARKGETVSVALVASNTPTGWSATGLPSGLSIHATTGVISGTVTADLNIYGYTITATNADGSDELTGYYVIDAQESLVGSGQLALELVIDIITKKVRVTGMPPGILLGPPALDASADTPPALFSAKRGERLPVSITFERDGVRQDLDVNTITCMAKEFEPDGNFSLFTGGITKTGTGEDARYRTYLYLNPDDWDGILSDNEADLGTAINALTEIKSEITETGDAYDNTESATLSPSLSGASSATQDHVLSFTGIPKTSAAETFDLDLGLVVSGDPAQSVTLARTVDVSWNGSTYDVADLTGPASGSGTDNTANGMWQSTLAQVAIAGTSSGIDLTLRASASTVADRYQIVIDLNNNANLSIASGAIVHTLGIGYDGTFYGQSSDLATDESFVISHGNTATAVKTAINSLPSPVDSEVSDVYFNEDAQTVTVVLTDGVGDMEQIYDDLSGYTYSRSQLIAGGSKSGSVSGQLSIASIDNSFVHFTETFYTRLERSLHP